MDITGRQIEVIGLVYGPSSNLKIEETNLVYTEGKVIDVRAEGSDVSYLIAATGDSVTYTERDGFGPTVTLEARRIEALS